MKISYYDNCDTDYVKKVKECHSLNELISIVQEYREIAEDACQAVEKMDQKQFEEFCKGRNKTNPSMKWMKMYGAVLLPRKILEIGLIACQFHVPFGAAYHRVKQVEAKQK